MTLMAPKNKWEFSDMVKFAVDFDGPIAIRYPRGEAYDGLAKMRAPIVLGKSETLYDEEEICLIAFGSMVKTAVKVSNVRRECKKRRFRRTGHGLFRGMQSGCPSFKYCNFG